MGRKKYYMTLDTETATLPFADSLVEKFMENNPFANRGKLKQSIAIAKPLVYDLGWVITDTQGNIVKKENWLVQETFFVPNIFNTAYYKNKRPIYMEKLAKNEISVGTWKQVTDIMVADMEKCDMICAYNACFDFKKAIPFTERYINALYSADYQKWEDNQKYKCINILSKNNDSKNESYLEPYFEFRNNFYPLCDLWGVSCDRLINEKKYKKFCMENELVTASVQYFKTSAETSFQFIMRDKDFIEEHTALSDAIIESYILTKALKKGKLEPSITAFPFRNLGSTFDYVISQAPKTKKEQYQKMLLDKLIDYIEENEGENKAYCDNNKYWLRMVRQCDRLKEVYGY